LFHKNQAVLSRNTASSAETDSIPCWVSTIMLLPTGVKAVSFLAIAPHSGDQLQIGFENLQVAPEEPLKVGHLVENHPFVVGSADIFCHRRF
jgi:hypothetical protein